LYDLYSENSVKKRKQIYSNACFLGEATVSEWIWVSFYRNKIVTEKLDRSLPFQSQQFEL